MGCGHSTDVNSYLDRTKSIILVYCQNLMFFSFLVVQAAEKGHKH